MSSRRQTPRTPPPTAERLSYRTVHRRLVLVYVEASLIAVFGGAVLFGFGLDMTYRQILIGVGIIAPVSFVLMFALDVLTIGIHARPVLAFLRALPDRPAPAAVTDALVRAINLPVFAAARVMLVHAPTAAVSITLLMVLLNRHMALGLGGGQIATLWALVGLVGVGHATVEYFLVAAAMRPAIPVLWSHAGPLSAEARGRIIPVGMRPMMLLVSVFLVLVPLLVLGFTLMVKVNTALAGLGVADAAAVTWPLYRWILVLVAGSMAIVLFMSIRAAREV
ncbi:MAG: hypothetical protein ACREMB_25520, partial [Candidatus Rokuibacteriota bacterium]